MERYSHLFSTLYDEQEPVGKLGRGTHCTVFRTLAEVRVGLAADPQPVRNSGGYTLHFHDFAVIWDEDHDRRIIWLAEQLHARGLLRHIVVLGERKASVTALTRYEPTDKLLSALEEIGGSLPSDIFSVSTHRLGESCDIVDDEASRVEAYLGGVDALWKLGLKPVTFATEAFCLGL